MNVFAQRLKKLREEYGLYQKELAGKIGVKRGTVAAWEAGRLPERSALEKLANFFGTSVDYLLGRTDFFTPEYKPNPVSGSLNNLLDKTKNLRPSQQQAIKSILSAVENVADEFCKNNIKSTNNKKNYVEILDLLDKEDINLTVGGRPLTLEERIQILEFLKEKISDDDDEQAATKENSSAGITIAASYQGDSLIQDPSPEDIEDIKKAIEFAENRKGKKNN
ncbi:transcriptional regulator with XRE-family HTH domain [Desulfohalotomaculum tongense]|uniref:helix-turn-helix domain-containing protein n=1 Tax=Desulforadius tongensis TaxID=1216062 RepID=UPI00195DD622|nr:helix-turn-helix transcriptional regulator [Desulforadius tongensis]MBM7856212.1 transcriptional regulator with XRE-family HTH domain [Desulforadius tongensis]